MTAEITLPVTLEYIRSRSIVEGECWIWQGATERRGYGHFGRGDRTYKAHRVAYQLVHGVIESGVLICHHCDRTACVNPAHLFAGSQKDNVADMHTKGRARNGIRPRGERHPRAKLTWAMVREIRRLWREERVGPLALSRQFGVSHSAIQHVIYGRHWLEPEEG